MVKTPISKNGNAKLEFRRGPIWVLDRIGYAQLENKSSFPSHRRLSTWHLEKSTATCTLLRRARQRNWIYDASASSPVFCTRRPCHRRRVLNPYAITSEMAAIAGSAAVARAAPALGARRAVRSGSALPKAACARRNKRVMATTRATFAGGLGDDFTAPTPAPAAPAQAFNAASIKVSRNFRRKPPRPPGSLAR